MNGYGRIAYAVSAAATLLSLAACANNAPGPAPAASAVAGPAPSTLPSSEQPEVSIEASPTVAQVQDWVEIFSGPADRDLPTPADRYAGRRTVELNATADDRIGTYVTDGAGMTLYRFDKDADQARPACNGQCAENWPPVLIRNPGKIYPSGVDPQRVSYLERADGTCQVAVDGSPLYYYARDQKPGDVNGQGVQGTWFAVSPTGGKTRNLPEVVESPAAQQ